MAHLIILQIQARMRKSIDAFKEYLSTIRTNIAQPSLLSTIMVNCYGTDMPINQLAYITFSGARTLIVTPFDKKNLNSIEKCIRNAGLGFNPTPHAETIRLTLPPLSAENRELYKKKAREGAEQARISIRNIRRETNENLRTQQKNKMMTEDEEHRLMDETQKVTHEYIAEIEQMLFIKEKELMEI